MEKRKLGRSNLEITPLVFGCNVFGWTADESMSFKLLDRFIDAGFNMIDTADMYATWIQKGGISETIIGKWLKRTGKRDKVLIATKVGMEMSPEKKGLSKAYILSEVEESLHRLQTDYIDLYQSHRDDSETPMEETLEAFSELVKQGKVRVIGASNYKGDRLKESLSVSERLGYPRYESLQPLYNLYDRADYEKDLEPLCLKESIGVIPYFSLAAGFLTGKYRSEDDLSKSPRGERVKKYLNDRGTRILNALDQVSKAVNASPAMVSLAWMIARPSITAPIASATNLEQLEVLIKATQLKLDQSSIELLNQASAPNEDEA
ncbi:MAG TPA: aldo/keto reductase [Blastocatellia bacterium]|nr:aldo/keto reductase [Blastocatellia bacterium]